MCSAWVIPLFRYIYPFLFQDFTRFGVKDRQIICKCILRIIIYFINIWSTSWPEMSDSFDNESNWLLPETQHVPVSTSDISHHYNDVIMGVIEFQITSLTSVYSIVYSGVDQRKHQSSASLAFVWGIHLGPVNSLRKWPITRKMFPFDDVIM